MVMVTLDSSITFTPHCFSLRCLLITFLTNEYCRKCSYSPKRATERSKRKNGHLENVAPPQSFHNHSKEMGFGVLIVRLLTVRVNEKKETMLLKSLIWGQ